MPINILGMIGVEKATSEVRCVQQPHVPIWFGGVSDPAIAVGAQHCDTYALFGAGPMGDVWTLQHIDVPLN